MLRNATLTTAVAAFIAVCGAPAAFAKTVVVKKNGPIDTIQGGVDAASAGDEVLVKSGVYEENVVVPALKTNLSLIAKGQVVLDARPGGVTGSGPGLRILAANVTVKGFDIRHAKDHPSDVAEQGNGIIAASSGLRVQDCSFSGHARESILATNATGMKVLKCEFRGGGSGRAINAVGGSVQVVGSAFRNVKGGVLVVGAGARIEKNLFETCHEAGIDITGASARVEGNRFRGVDNKAISVVGASCLVRANVAEHVGAAGIDIIGGSAKVLKNRLTGVDGGGILISGDGASVAKNQVRYADGPGLEIDSDDASVRKNRLEYCESYGIDFIGDDSELVKNKVSFANGYGIHSRGSGNDLLQNDVRGNMNTDTGIYVTGVADIGGTVSGNRVRWSNNSGIEISFQLSNITFVGNHVERCGSANSNYGIYIAGSGHEVRKNSSRRNSGDGFIMYASNMNVIDNEATDNGRDGFDVGGGTNVLLRNNVAKGNLGEGIEVNAAGTRVEKNQSSKNRIDFATSVVLGAFSGNSFADGSSTTTLPEID